MRISRKKFRAFLLLRYLYLGLGGGGGGTPMYWQRVCAAGEGMVFKPFGLV